MPATLAAGSPSCGPGGATARKSPAWRLPSGADWRAGPGGSRPTGRPRRKRPCHGAGPRRRATRPAPPPPPDRRRDRRSSAAGDIEIDFVLDEIHAAIGFQHREQHGQPTRIPAHHGAARRADALARPVPGSRPAPAWCPPSRRRRPRPAADPSRPARNSADGLATSSSPAPVISNTPISSVGPKRFLTLRRMRNWWPRRRPRRSATASTICSTTRGPAICHPW